MENKETESASVFDVLDEAHEAVAIALAQAQIEAGLGVPHEKVRNWLTELAAGKRTPPPTA